MRKWRRPTTTSRSRVPPGRPQIRYFAPGDQWVPRGGVLRCVIDDGGPDGEAIIHVDDQALSLAEFGRMLCTYAGWGMRIAFVPEDAIAETADHRGARAGRGVVAGAAGVAHPQRSQHR